jgi:hypothetical protein
MQGDLRLATHLFRETIAMAVHLPRMEVLLSPLMGMLGVALIHGPATRAARLLGAVEAGRDSLGIPRVANWLHAERITADTRGALPTELFEQARAAGRTLSLDEAVTEALAIADEVVTGATD